MGYNYIEGHKKIKEILSNNTSISKEKTLPKDDSQFTYGNGVKSWVGSIFIDIIGSTNLIKNTNELTVSKMLRAFTSECISVLNLSDNMRQIGVRGDCVYGIYSSPYQSDIHELLIIACYLNTLVRMLNKEFTKKGYPNISVGIGIGAGEDLIIKAGAKGTGINDKIWIGDAVVDACNLANKAGRNGKKTIGLSSVVYNNVIDIEKNNHADKDISSWFTRDFYDNAYYCSMIMTDFDDWIDKNL